MTYYQIFQNCFPFLPTGEAAFARMAELSGCMALTCREKGVLKGYALLRGGELRLLCVLPEYRGQGVGSRMLAQAEACAKAHGFRELVVGGPSSPLFQGAPEQARGFFEKKGYVFGDRYEEMERELNGFSAADFSLPVPEGVQFGLYKGDLPTLHAAVRAVEEDWVQYFQADSPVFCATLNGKIASFCIAEAWENGLLSDGKNKVGAPGCVGTVPAFRRQGIGLKMVALACEELKKQGCGVGFIHYTGVAPWYARLGFRTFLSWSFCKKSLE